MYRVDYVEGSRCGSVYVPRENSTDARIPRVGELSGCTLGGRSNLCGNDVVAPMCG